LITPSRIYEELSIAEKEEHPMCVNMIPSVNAMLVQAPSVISDSDEDGWTMVHRDALAGNASVVDLLVKAGADAHKKNSNGHSAYDLASMAKWPLVLDAIPPPNKPISGNGTESNSECRIS
jgi:ankyrin repeat protein